MSTGKRLILAHYLVICFFSYAEAPIRHKEPPQPKTNSSPSILLGGTTSPPITEFNDGYCYGHAKVYGAYREILSDADVQAAMKLSSLETSKLEKHEAILSALNKIKKKLNKNDRETEALSKLLAHFMNNPDDLGRRYVDLINEKQGDNKIAALVIETHQTQDSDWLQLTDYPSNKDFDSGNKNSSNKKTKTVGVIEALNNLMKMGQRNPALAFGIKGIAGGHAVYVESIKNKPNGGHVIEVRDSLFPKTLSNPDIKYQPEKIEITMDKDGKVVSFKKYTKDVNGNFDEGIDIIRKKDLPNLFFSTYSIKDNNH